MDPVNSNQGPSVTSQYYHNIYGEVLKSDSAFVHKGIPSFLTKDTMPRRKPSTAGWLTDLDMSMISHRPHQYNPVDRGQEPMYVGTEAWPQVHLRVD